MRRDPVRSFAGATVVGWTLIGAAGVGVPSASAPAQVRQLAPMATARAAHTATLLPDGQVLVVGGFTADESLVAGAERFDHVRGEWQAVTGGTRRQGHSATRLTDGRVLLVGGYGDGAVPLTSAEIYDPAAGTFVATGVLGTARAGHEAVLLTDGRVLVIGGVSLGWTFLATAEIYDPATGRFEATGAMAEPRESHAAVRLGDGRVLVIGGHAGRRADIRIYASTEVFDPRTSRFSPAAPMAVRRHKHDATALPTGQVLVSGGADERDERGVYATTEVFDVSAMVFRPGPALRRGRYKHRGTSVVLADGRVLLAGGSDEPEVLDVATGGGVVLRGVEPLAGQFSAAVRLAGGRVLIVGGYGSGTRPRSGAWMFEP